ncbi:hypothetical protein [Streptomyces sp. ITFR-16]|uniref:hypothetical protein n=1 Tax=Streptomyces sp. ITFR-16 TaxID=3075198 RepID=UPI00288BA697|nr:hypothetical protein [Streptomyces sp. ITFR-16]WNI23782.1 hypothetical protein RLT58_18485 [Streptomyces sp. ITFR-16]
MIGTTDEGEAGMSRPGKRWYVRGVAAGAAALMLAGCGGGGDGDGGAAKALTKAEVASVLPDAKAMPGWRTQLAPEARKPAPEYPPTVCLAKDSKKRAAACGKITYWGVSGYVRKPDGTSLNFWVLAYKEAKEAGTAYDALAEYYGGDRVGPDAQPVEIGELGDERESHRAATGTMGGPATITQLRVGTTVLGVSSGNQGAKTFTDQEVKAVAGLFAERARQAQNGEKPTSALTGQ